MNIWNSNAYTKKNEPFKEQKVNFEFDGKNLSLKSWVIAIFTTEYHPLFC